MIHLVGIIVAGLVLFLVAAVVYSAGAVAGRADRRGWQVEDRVAGDPDADLMALQSVQDADPGERAAALADARARLDAALWELELDPADGAS